MPSEPKRVSAALASGVNPGSKPRTMPAIAGRHDGTGAGNSDPNAPAVEMAKALGAGWLELWYQPKIGSQTLDLRGAEALIRLRHPQLGIVQPAAFMPRMGERLSPALSQFVIAQALADWRYFLAEQRPLDLSINLPTSFLDDPASFDYLCRQLPDDPAFAGLILEVDGSEISRDLSTVRGFAKQARLRKVAVSVDRLGGEWTTLLQLRDFPFVEIKVEPELVAGCAHDRAKQTLCRHIVSAASQFGARTVAVGVENYADFLTARELGFDLVQGFFFAKPHGGADIRTRFRARSDTIRVISRRDRRSCVFTFPALRCAASRPIKAIACRARAQWQAPAQAAILLPWQLHRQIRVIHAAGDSGAFRCVRWRRIWSLYLPCVPD